VVVLMSAAGYYGVGQNATRVNTKDDGTQIFIDILLVLKYYFRKFTLE
jgi:hypothetical protein